MVVLAILAGCTIQLSCELYNNTGATIIVVQAKTEGDVSRFSVAASSSIRLDGWNLFRYEIIHGSATWKYTIPSVSDEYISYSGTGPWKKRIVKAQIESDGGIFVLNADQTAPLSKLPQQPEEFPLRPE